MTTDDNINDNTDSTPTEGVSPDRSLGFWLRLVEHQLATAFRAEFEADGLDRREWMALNLLSGEVHDERLARFAERAARHGGRFFRDLADRGLVTETDGVWTLTAAGRAQREAFTAHVDAIRERAAAAVSPEDHATTVASLEAIARELGWDGTERMPRGFGRGRHGFGPRGFGPGFGPGFGHGFGPGFGPGFGHGHGRPGFGPEYSGAWNGEHDGARRCGHGGTPDGDHHAHHHHPHHRGGHGRKAERSYERGFEAGFAAASRVTSQS